MKSGARLSAEYKGETTKILIRAAFFLRLGFASLISLDSAPPRSIHTFSIADTGFSKKLENHGHMVALHFMHYNFARVHKTLRITPAMAAGITDHVWSLEEIAMLADAAFVPTKRGPYKKERLP